MSNYVRKMDLKCLCDNPQVEEKYDGSRDYMKIECGNCGRHTDFVRVKNTMCTMTELSAAIISWNILINLERDTVEKPTET